MTTNKRINERNKTVTIADTNLTFLIVSPFLETFETIGFSHPCNVSFLTTCTVGGCQCLASFLPCFLAGMVHMHLLG